MDSVLMVIFVLKRSAHGRTARYRHGIAMNHLNRHRMRPVWASGRLSIVACRDGRNRIAGFGGAHVTAHRPIADQRLFSSWFRDRREGRGHWRRIADSPSRHPNRRRPSSSLLPGSAPMAGNEFWAKHFRKGRRLSSCPLDTFPSRGITSTHPPTMRVLGPAQHDRSMPSRPLTFSLHPSIDPAKLPSWPLARRTI